MINKLKIFLSIFLVSIFFNSLESFAVGGTMNYSVTPIKQRIEINPGQNAIKTASITNRGNTSVTMKISVSDLTADNITGSPILLTRRNEEVFDQILAPWITLQTTSITLDPKETKEIAFSINVPANATPGGHYGAIIFQDNNSSNASSGNSTTVNVHYGSIIILKVNGEVVVDGEVGDINIDSSNSGLGSSKGIDKCPLGDFTKSNYDNKCVDLEIVDKYINSNKNSLTGKTEENNSKEKIEKLKKELEKIKKEKENIEKEFKKYKEKGGKTQTIEEFTKEIKNKQKNIEDEINKISKEIDNKKSEKNSEKKGKDFGIKFKIPIVNKGNSHLHPEGKIVLKDENGKIIKRIGKEVIINEKGAVIGTKIVDYLPINNSDGDVFPKKERLMQIEWKGFPYEIYNEKGEKEINFFSPSEYYTKQSMGGDRVMMPWERVCSKLNNKTITAYTDISYLDENGKKVTTKKENIFKISYIEEYIGYNYYILLCAGVIFFILFILFLLLILNKRKCINPDCKKKIKKDMNVCPYCGTVQDGKKKGKKIKLTK